MPTEIDFFTFVYKRHLIWYKRFILKQQPPWTDDPILKKFKLINVYRELDKCTIYLINKLKSVSNRETLLINIIFYRFFNLMNLYEDLGIQLFPTINEDLQEQLIRKFTQLQKTRPIFNNAYIISSGGKGSKHVNIINNLVNINLPDLITKLDNAKTPEESFFHLTALPMVGPFLACEFWTDLTYFKFFPQQWTDNDFVNIGPGAKWGLEILYGNISQESLQERLHHLHQIQRKILSTINTSLSEKLSWEEIAYKEAYSNYPYLSITNIEGSLCEFRKYWNISHGKGRRKYFAPQQTNNLLSFLPP